MYSYRSSDYNQCDVPSTVENYVVCQPVLASTDLSIYKPAAFLPCSAPALSVLPQPSFSCPTLLCPAPAFSVLSQPFLSCTSLLCSSPVFSVLHQPSLCPAPAFSVLHQPSLCPVLAFSASCHSLHLWHTNLLTGTDWGPQELVPSLCHVPLPPYTLRGWTLTPTICAVFLEYFFLFAIYHHTAGLLSTLVTRSSSCARRHRWARCLRRLLSKYFNMRSSWLTSEVFP